MTHEPPRSADYGDTYYSAEDGWAECAHVFVRGNRLAERFAGLREGEVFVVGELGYGTGLNVAAAMAAFAARGHRRGHLAVFTVEGHPLSEDDFAAHAASAAERWPGAAAALTALARTYPAPRDGFVRTRPAPDVALTIGFGEAAAVLGAAQLRADAWFLDGFSPALNPAMWSEEVLAHVARLSKPSATAATFTVAGAVRRGLAAAGFEVAKATGFGRKREMLTATLAERPEPGPPAVLGQSAVLDAPPGGPIAVLGGGIAGACAAWHLARAGQAVTVFDPRGPASGASGNPGGLVSPRVEAADNTAARFYRDAYLHALSFYAEIAPDAFDRTGAVVRMAPERAAKVLSTRLWPDGTLAPHPDGLAAPGAGVLRPAAAVAALLDGIEVGARGTLAADGDVLSVDGAPFASVVVAAPALAATLDLGTDAPVLTGKRGQIDLFGGEAPTITGDGYVAGLDGGLMAGATYAPAGLNDRCEPTTADTAANQGTAARLLGAPPGPHRSARAAVRAATPDRHPLAGPVPDVPALKQTHAALRHGGAPTAEPPARPGLFVLSGLGSRGLVTAPLLGAYLADLITGAPPPVTSDTSAWLHPARFALRRMRRKDA